MEFSVYCSRTNETALHLTKKNVKDLAVSFDPNASVFPRYWAQMHESGKQNKNDSTDGQNLNLSCPEYYTCVGKSLFNSGEENRKQQLSDRNKRFGTVKIHHFKQPSCALHAALSEVA